MWVISIIFIFGVINIKRSLVAIQKNTEKMENHTYEMNEKVKKIDTLINGMKDLLVKIS